MAGTQKAQTASDALVVFGMTGDLVCKKRVPALYAMVKRDALDVPVVGVASSKLTLAQRHKRIIDSIKWPGKIDDKPTFINAVPTDVHKEH